MPPLMTLNLNSVNIRWSLLLVMVCLFLSYTLQLIKAKQHQDHKMTSSQICQFIV